GGGGWGVCGRGVIGGGLGGGWIGVWRGVGVGAGGIGSGRGGGRGWGWSLMGSGNAAFFAFGPLVPKIAKQLGVESTSIILPMQLSASMGRTVSPVAGVIIAVSEVAGVNTMSIVKRNLIPLTAALLVMLCYHFI